MNKKQVSRELPEEFIQQLNQEGFMTAGTGDYWGTQNFFGDIKQKEKKELKEILKFESILLKWASADEKISIRDYLASGVPIPKGEGHTTDEDYIRWTNDLIDRFCGAKSSSPAELGAWYSYHKLFRFTGVGESRQSIYEMVRNAFVNPVQIIYIRRFIDYAQQLDRNLLYARKLLKEMFDFYIARNQIDHPIENILFTCSQCVEGILSARLTEDHIGKCIEEALSERDIKQTTDELTELKKKMPELNQITDHLEKFGKWFSAHATVKKISQEDMADQVRRAAVQFPLLKRYQHCTRETICHWENRIATKPEWYDKKIRFSSQTIAMAAIIDGMQKEYEKKETCKNISNPRLFK